MELEFRVRFEQTSSLGKGDGERFGPSHGRLEES